MAVEKYVRADGSTVYLAVYFLADGSRRKEKIEGAVVPSSAAAQEHKKAQRKAALHASEQRARIENGEWIDPREKRPAASRAQKLHALIDEFLLSYVPRSGSTDGYYDNAAKAWKRLLPNKPARAVSVADVDAFRAARIKEVSPSTVRKNLVALGTLFRWAEARRLIDENPADPRKVRRPPEAKHRVTYLTDDDERRLLEASPAWLQRVIRWALNTGMDRSEIIDLTWHDVDEIAGVVHAPRSKTGTPRNIPLNATLSEILKECRKGASIGADHRVFLNAEKRPLTALGLKGSLAYAYKKARLPHSQPAKTLRHTFASRLAMRGVSMPSIARLMGHTTQAITDHYAHLSPGYLRDAMGTLDHPVRAPKAEPEPDASGGAFPK